MKSGTKHHDVINWRMIQTRAELDKGQFNKRQNQVGDSWKRGPNTRDVFVWYTFLKVSIYTSLRVPGAFGLHKIKHA